MTPVETLREAARLMRERAEEAAKPWHGWGDTRLPQRSGTREWSEDMKGYLGGSWGVHAASWHPAVALAVADWLDAYAAVATQGYRNAHEDTALTVARTYLGEAL